MKYLKDYIKLPVNKSYNKEKPYIYVKENYIGYNNVICQTDDGKILNDFDDFIKENNITNIDEGTYRFFLDSIYDNNYKYIDNPYTYNHYQQDLYMFENIVKSYSAHKLYDKIKELSDNIINVKYVNNKDITQFEIFFDNSEHLYDILDNSKFWNILHLYNYYDKYIYDSDKRVSIILEPYKPKDITDKIYNELNGILYHITDMDIYSKHIKNKSINTKWKRSNEFINIFRDGRIFFIGNNNEDIVRSQLQGIYHTSTKIKNPIVLKINLKEYRNKLRFRIDSSASGYNAYFTEEPIPDYCITCLDLDTWKEIDKKEI